MPDPRSPSTPVARSARELDAQCRGRDTTPAFGGEPGMGRGRARHPSLPPDVSGDVPVVRPVIREADRQDDGQVARWAVTVAAAEALTQEAAERSAESWRLPAADGSAGASEAASAELIRLLDRLCSTVTRYVRGRRDAGAPIERVLPEVKGLVREAVAHERWFDPAGTMMAHVVGWTITAYYQAHDGEGSPDTVAQCGASRHRT